MFHLHLVLDLEPVELLEAVRAETVMASVQEKGFGVLIFIEADVAHEMHVL
jgi:hypothetical protein